MRKISEYTLKKSSEHIYYEAWMLFEVMRLLLTSKDQLFVNILLESFSIHSRNLFDFLYPKSKSKNDDILVYDYIQFKKLYNINKTKKKELNFIIRKANKQVAHLTYSRNKFGTKNKPWPFVSIGNKMRKSLIAFYDALPEKYKQWYYFIQLKEILK